MFNVKGFISIDSLIKNTAGIVAPLGEFSTYSSTFSTNVGEYSDPTIAGFQLNTLYTFDDTAGSNFVVTQPAALHILTIAMWIYNYNVTHTNTYTPTQLIADLAIAFPAISNASASSIVSDASNWIPEYVIWTNTALNYQVKIWFSDASLRTEYDQYEIVVIPPVTPLSLFFGTPTALSAALAANTSDVQLAAVAAAKNSNPETILVAHTYNFVTPGTGALIPTVWYAIVYGPNGNNDDAIKAALQSYILSNSTETQAQWQAVLPDVFLSTEFTFVPMWASIAIPNMTLQAGVYSPIASPGAIMTGIAAAIPNYPTLQCTSNVQIVPVTYKSLNLLSVGGPQNRNNQYLITNYFPDYIDVGTASTDFDRQSTATQTFATLLEELVIQAESATAYSTLPSNMRRIIRGSQMYIGASLNNILYLVSAKTNTTGF